ncbi:ribonuclease H-like domain-containing protein [Mycena capillaripes]|nr:ribonuclease H-like domain-containing protein [Mycena capillaripes]
MNTVIALCRSCFASRSSPLPSSMPMDSTPATDSTPARPMQPYPTPHYFYIVTIHQADRHLQTIRDGEIIGFDLEAAQRSGGLKLTKGQKKAKLAAEIQEAANFTIDWSQVTICLVQIATANGHVYVINLHLMAALPAELVRICMSHNILKVSAGIFSDGQRLWDSFRLNLVSVISLGLVARLAYPTELLNGAPFGNEPALGLIIAHALRYRLSKEQQTSDWDAASLSDEQKDYAASDAHATLEAFRAMDAVLQRCAVPSSVELGSGGLLSVHGGRRTLLRDL